MIEDNKAYLRYLEGKLGILKHPGTDEEPTLCTEVHAILALQ